MRLEFRVLFFIHITFLRFLNGSQNNFKIAKFAILKKRKKYFFPTESLELTLSHNFLLESMDHWILKVIFFNGKFDTKKNNRQSLSKMHSKTNLYI